MTGGYSAIIASQNIPQAALKQQWTTGVSFLNTPIGTGTGLVTFPSNYFYVNKRLRVTAIMAISNVITAQPYFTFTLQFGSILIWTSGNVTTNSTAHTSIPSKLVVELRCATVGLGTAATFMGVGLLTGFMWTGAATADGAGGALCLPASIPAAGSGWDSTIANTLDFYVACQTNAVGNGCQLFEYYVEDLN
jgi:hypothetical protein